MIDGLTTIYIGNYYEVKDPAGTPVVKKYYYAGSTRIAMSDNGLVRYFVTDHLGSTTRLINTDGSEYSETEYLSWGTDGLASTLLGTSFKYTGQREAEAGLYFYNARWYDPEIGRFIQADTLIPDPGNPLAWDRYEYAMNNPKNYVDPSGHIATQCSNDNDCGGSFRSSSIKDSTGSVSSHGSPNRPDPSQPATTPGRLIHTDCLPGNLINCFQNHGVMPAGYFNVSLKEYLELMLKIIGDIDKQDPRNSYENYSKRTWYDTPFFDYTYLEGTICIDGIYCRTRQEVNYIAQGAWSASVYEGIEGAIASDIAWKLKEYHEVPSFGTIMSTVEGYAFYEMTHPSNFAISVLGYKDYSFGMQALKDYWPKIKSGITQR